MNPGVIAFFAGGGIVSLLGLYSVLRERFCARKHMTPARLRAGFLAGCVLLGAMAAVGSAAYWDKGVEEGKRQGVWQAAPVSPSEALSARLQAELLDRAQSRRCALCGGGMCTAVRAHGLLGLSVAHDEIFYHCPEHEEWFRLVKASCCYITDRYLLVRPETEAEVSDYFRRHYRGALSPEDLGAMRTKDLLRACLIIRPMTRGNPTKGDIPQLGIASCLAGISIAFLVMAVVAMVLLGAGALPPRPVERSREEQGQ